MSENTQIIVSNNIVEVLGTPHKKGTHAIKDLQIYYSCQLETAT